MELFILVHSVWFTYIIELYYTVFSDSLFFFLTRCYFFACPTKTISSFQANDKTVNYLESIQVLIVLLFLFSLANSVLFANFATAVKFTAVKFNEMKFYDREEQLKTLREMRELSYNGYSRLTVVTGRRRIGKTTLIKEAYKDEPYVYLFVGRKSEAVLCCAENSAKSFRRRPGDSFLR